MPRSLHLDATGCEALRRQRAWQARQAERLGPLWRNDLDLVFTAESGRPLQPDTISRAFKETIEALPVPRIRLHDLRVRHEAPCFRVGVRTHLRAVAAVR